MIEYFVIFLETHILPWGAVGVFVASVLEEVVAPIPSALVMTMSGFLLVSGAVGLETLGALLFKVALPAGLGVALGSLPVYFVVRYGGRFVIERWGKYLGLYWSDIEKMQTRLSGTRKDEVVIATARIIPVVPSVAISALCGIIEMPVLKYLVITFLGMFVRGIILGAVGWQVGNVYAKYAEMIGQIEKYVLLGLILFALAFVVFRLVQKYRH